MLVLFASSFLALTTNGQPAKPNKPDVVVTGYRIQQAKADLNACLARHCPTNEDIDASLALAESQIVAGKYRDARETLLASLGRNKDEAKRYPIPVSDLYRANGRVAAHLGFDSDYYSSTWGIYRTLKAGLPSDETRHFQARMEVAEMMGDTRGHTRARLYYESIARDARKARRPDIAALAELRMLLRHMPPGATRDASIRKIANSADPSVRAAALEGKLALARMAYENNDIGAADAIQKQFAAMNIQRPILIYAPYYEAPEKAPDNGSEFGVTMAGKQGGSGSAGRSGGGGGMTVVSVLPYAQWSTTSRIAPSFDDMWVDIGFRITPEGTVAEPKILRSRGDTFWTKGLMTSVEGRRYTPGRTGDPNSYRVERYTYTSPYESQTGSHMVDRSPNGRVEYFDLSPMGIAAPQ